MHTAKFGLGDTLKEEITGFSGVVMGVTFYYTGCIHYSLQGKKLDDKGLPVDWQWFDESRLKLLKAAKKEEEKKRSSGAFPNAPAC